MTLCISFSVLQTACDSFLDRQEDELLTFDQIWETRANTKAYWHNAMSRYPNDVEGYVYAPWLGASDEGVIAHRAREVHKITSGSWHPANIPRYEMDKYYKGIRECNIFLQNVDRCTDPLLTLDEKEQWKVQTRFARAYYYFLMMRIYGPVFMLGDEIVDFAAPVKSLERPRTPWDDCVKYVVGELTDIKNSPYMKATWESTSENGLATKGACQAIISRLTLYSARALFNGNKMYANVKNPDGTPLFPQKVDDDKWKVAAEAAKDIIDEGNYTLYRDKSNNRV